MFYKVLRKIKYKNLNRLYLKFQMKSNYMYPIYDLVIVPKKSRCRGKKSYDKIGFFNPSFTERLLFFNTSKLYY